MLKNKTTQKCLFFQLQLVCGRPDVEKLLRVIGHHTCPEAKTWQPRFERQSRGENGSPVVLAWDVRHVKTRGDHIAKTTRG